MSRYIETIGDCRELGLCFEDKEGDDANQMLYFFFLALVSNCCAENLLFTLNIFSVGG